MQSRPEGPDLLKPQNSDPWEFSDTFLCLTCSPELDMVIQRTSDVHTDALVLYIIYTLNKKMKGADEQHTDIAAVYLYMVCGPQEHRAQVRRHAVNGLHYNHWSTNHLKAKTCT